MSAQKQEYLKLPASYQEIPEEEMYYIDGGGYIPTWTISTIVDIALIAFGVGAIFA